jgi:hypothetical protein
MVLTTSNTLMIIIVAGVALYLIYSKYKQDDEYGNGMRSMQMQPNPGSVSGPYPTQMPMQPSMQMPMPMPPPMSNPTKIVIDNNPTDPYSDSIKRQDLYTMYDPLTYPQLRLPREVLEKYQEYYRANGVYPPFGENTQPYLFDNPIMNGYLTRIPNITEAFSDNTPSTVPLFRVKNTKNSNRYFYYVIDQRYLSKIETKIPLDHIKLNGTVYNNADFYGLPEIFDGDLIENIPIYPGISWKVTLYKVYHFP